MKNKKNILIILLFIVLIGLGIIRLLFNEKYLDDENTLYSITFNDVKIRFERYDYSLGQNQIVGVEKITNNGKNIEKLTKEQIIVSMNPMFIFINEKLGFSISKANLSKSNNYMGLKVTHDGGITFTSGVINYDNPNIEILTVKNVPYLEDGLLKLPCSIYQVKEDKSGYEDIDLIFISNDEGITWNLGE